MWNDENYARIRSTIQIIYQILVKEFFKHLPILDMIYLAVRDPNNITVIMVTSHFWNG